MTCHCRLVTLKSFINGLAQVHKVDVFPASSQLFSLPKQSLSQSQSQTRGFRDSRHASRQQNGDSPAPGISQSGQKTKMRWRDLPPGDLKAKVQKRDNFERKLAVKADKKDLKVDKKMLRVDKKDPELPEGQQKRTVSRNPTGTPRTWTKSKAAGATTATATGPKTFKKPFRKPESAATDSESNPKKQEDWSVQKARLKEKFPEGWKPRKRLSPDALAGLRALNAQFPEVYTTEALATKFEMSAEAVRRILRSKWQPNEEEETDRHDRWHRRGMQIWETKAALGVKPPRKWRAEGIARDPSYHDRRRVRIQRDQAWEEEEIRKYREYREGLQKAATKII